MKKLFMFIMLCTYILSSIADASITTTITVVDNPRIDRLKIGLLKVDLNIKYDSQFLEECRKSFERNYCVIDINNFPKGAVKLRKEYGKIYNYHSLFGNPAPTPIKPIEDIWVRSLDSTDKVKMYAQLYLFDNGKLEIKFYRYRSSGPQPHSMEAVLKGFKDRIESLPIEEKDFNVAADVDYTCTC